MSPKTSIIAASHCRTPQSAPGASYAEDKRGFGKMEQQSVNRRESHSPADWQIEVFFDGDCPLCKREIDMLRRRDRRRNIRFTNIAASDFRARDFGPAWDDFMSEIHGRLPDGTWVRGVEVFRRLYAAVGWSPVVWVTRLPIIAGLLDRAYRVFARNRLRWTRRCAPGSGTCSVDNSSSEVATSR